MGNLGGGRILKDGKTGWVAFKRERRGGIMPSFGDDDDDAIMIERI